MSSCEWLALYECNDSGDRDKYLFMCVQPRYQMCMNIGGFSRTNGRQESFLAHPFTNFQRHADPIIFWRGRVQLEAKIFDVSTAFRREIVELRRNLQGESRTSMRVFSCQ